MKITLKGTKKEIRREVHRLEEKGLLVKRCVASSNEGEIFTMEFDCEVQFGQWVEVKEEKLSKAEVVKEVSELTGASKKEVNQILNENEMPYWYLDGRHAQYVHRMEILAKHFNFNLI